MGREIPVTRAAVVALATEDIIAVAFGSWVLTRRARAHEGEVYRAPGNFTNSNFATKPIVAHAVSEPTVRRCTYRVPEPPHNGLHVW